MTLKSVDPAGGAFGPQMELLLALLRARVSKGARAPDVRLKSEIFDMLALANWHDVMPALAGGLENLGDPGWTDLLPFLAPAAQANAERNRVYVSSAHLVSQALTEASIPHVFTKGLAFFFDDPASLSWRTVSDIDLLVREAELREAAAVIQSLGYRQLPGATYEPRLHHHAAALIDDQTGVFYELHTRMMQAPRHNPFTFEDILAVSRPVLCDTLEVRVPSPEHRMFNLIAHAQISNWDYGMRQISIKSLLDAAELARRHVVDWQAVSRLFQQIRATPELMGFLAAGHRMMLLTTGLEVDADVAAHRWADEAIAALEKPVPRARIILRILYQYTQSMRQNPRRLEMLWHLFSTPGRMKELMQTLRGRLS